MRSALHDSDRHCACPSLLRIADALPFAIWITAADGSTRYENAAARASAPELREIAAFANGDRLRLIRQAGAELLVISGEGEKCCIATTHVNLSSEILRRMYGLTRAEARVAAKLASGRTLRQTAEELGSSLHTVRNHLRNLFAKTETRKQNELVALLVRGISTLRLDEADLTQLSHSDTRRER